MAYGGDTGKYFRNLEQIDVSDIEQSYDSTARLIEFYAGIIEAKIAGVDGITAGINKSISPDEDIRAAKEKYIPDSARCGSLTHKLARHLYTKQVLQELSNELNIMRHTCEEHILPDSKYADSKEDAKETAERVLNRFDERIFGIIFRELYFPNPCSETQKADIEKSFNMFGKFPVEFAEPKKKEIKKSAAKGKDMKKCE